MHKVLRIAVLVILFAPIAVLILTINTRPAIAPTLTPRQQEFILNTTDQIKEETGTMEVELMAPKEEVKNQIDTTIPQSRFVDVVFYENIIANLPPQQAADVVLQLSKLELGAACPRSDDPYQLDSLVDIDHSIKYYVPANLVQLAGRVPLKYSSLCLDALAFVYYEKMLQAAQVDNIEIVVTSGYRDRDTQNYLYKNALAKNPNREILSVAKPGHSEHQLGTTIDLTSPEINNRSTTEEFETTDAFAWLKANAAKYGFYLSYPKGNTSGYIYEPWHWRFMGKFIQ